MYYKQRTRAAASDLFLDTYPARNAYSLRKLRSGYTGNCINVRRSSDNTNQDIGFDGSGNLDTSALSSFVGANDGFIETWYDQVGSNDLLQATDANQPRIVSSGTIDTAKNGGTAAFFDGSAYYMQTAALSSYVLTSSSMVAIASERTNSNKIGGLFEEVRIASVPERIVIYSDTRTSKLFGNIAPDGTSDTITFSVRQTIDDDLYILQRAGNTITAYLNGASQGSTTNSASFSTSATAFGLGRQSNGTIYHQGYVQEAIVWDSDQSSNRTSIETNINNYYSLY